jgi:hypothetical protein
MLIFHFYSDGYFPECSPPAGFKSSLKALSTEDPPSLEMDGMSDYRKNMAYFQGNAMLFYGRQNWGVNSKTRQGRGGDRINRIYRMEECRLVNKSLVCNGSRWKATDSLKAGHRT